MFEPSPFNLALHCLYSIKNIGQGGLSKIIKYKDPVKFFNNANLKDFENVFKGKALDIYQEYHKIDKEILWSQEKAYFLDSQIQLVSIKDELYPKSLLEISAKPTLLYYKGNIENLGNTLAVIGTRKFSQYGKKVCTQIVKEVSKAGMVIVSGMALGIDSISHQACLLAGGRTIAVLGGGLDPKVIYPKSNLGLAKEIVETGGALISEFSPKTEPRKEFFPMRNRIVSGISKGLLVIEAPLKSGTMITVNFALEQNRDVFAIPGNIDQKNSEGTNYLISEGAIVVLNEKSILDQYNIDTNLEVRLLTEFTEIEQRIIHILNEKSYNLNSLSHKLDMDITNLMTEISMMELNEILISDSNGYYSLNIRIQS